MKVDISLIIYFSELISSFLFLLCFFGICSAGMVISMKNSVHAVFCLILTFCISSMILLTIVSDFLAIIFIIVYVGAIAVLFLFVVMMLNIKFIYFSESIVYFIPFSCFIGIIFISELFFGNFSQSGILDIQEQYFDWIWYFNGTDLIELIGLVLYTIYLPIFIIAAFILLLAMVGTINITLYHANNVKRQLLYKQLGRSVSTSILIK